MNTIQVWVGIIGLVAGLVTGGLGSAAIGSSMYNKLDNEFTNHVNYQAKQDVETATRLARIEENQKSQTKVLEDILEAIRR